MMRISRFIIISLIAMLAVSALVSCEGTLTLQARTFLTFNNFSNEPITEVTVRWPGLAEEGFVLKHRNGETVTLQAAPSEDSPFQIMLHDLNYFPRGSGPNPEFTATFQGGTTETVVTGNPVIEFAKPVAEVFTSSVSVTNGLSSAITGVTLHRVENPTDPTNGDFSYVIGLGLPLTGIGSGTSFTVNLNSTDQSRVTGTFHVFVLQEGESFSYAGPVTTSVGQTANINVE